MIPSQKIKVVLITIFKFLLKKNKALLYLLEYIDLLQQNTEE